jgi:hypothetical protein
MNRFLSHKQIIAAVVSVGVLLAIFVPFQKAEAYTVNLTLPNASTTAVPTSAVGSTFKVTIDVSAGELISISQIELILDNGNPGVKQAFFNADGHRTSGSPTLARGNLDITIPSPSTTGYGYGYGAVSSGSTFSSPYSYSFSYSNAFISGNNYGYSYAVTGANSVTGFVGPGQIVIEGKLNTAQMSVGTHTLDVLIYTGTGVNPDKLVAPQLTFTTVGNSSISSISAGSGNNVQILPSVTGVPPGKLKLFISNIQTGGSIFIEPFTSSGLLSEIPGIFTATGSSIAIFNIGSSGTGNSIGTIFDIDISALTLGSGAAINVTIPYDPTLLPAGVSESNVKFFHWNGSTWEDKTMANGVDTNAHTVTGTLTSLSPVVAGFAVPSASPSTSGGGGGGGGSSSSGGSGGGSSIDLGTTYSDDYFKNSPLAKVQIHSSTLVNAAGQTVYGAHPGQQIMIKNTFKNYQKHEQTYAMIVQVIDKDGFTSDIGWVTGTLGPGESTDSSKSWTAGHLGTYNVKLFVWDGVSATPTALSQVTTSSITVN